MNSRRSSEHQRSRRKRQLTDQERSSSDSVTPRRRVLVLGSSADVDYGLPTMATLMHDLAAFVREDGSPIDKTLRKKLPHLRFTFDRFAGDRGDDMIVQLFGGGEDIAPRLLSAAEKLKDDQEKMTKR